ncbi:RluA family pseudouridine synthase [Campylobacter sp. TTU-622]|uniref:RluA family pseudouridine synthase n=1 Tax=Campylobacter sp. TTU-622 TaxID=2800583 RepID=UPI001908E8D3|nr:RluA family pseudouridine synthase [Campylobacter sp. TTU-622]MBK1972866.1 RluA family pseudouridine synthase [Campylobacter sp. TTU-622]
MQNFLVSNDTRLDIFLSKSLEQSRNQVALLIKNGYVLVNQKIQTKNSFKLKIGDIVDIKEVILQEKKLKYEIDFDIDILYEDDDVIVLNKPPYLVVHGAKSVKEATLVDWLMQKNYTLSNLGGELRAGLVHRLDKQTSGAIIVAKNNYSHKILSDQLKDKSMGRIYLALINLPLKQDKIIIEKFLIRSPSNPIKKIAINEDLAGAKNAKSAFVNLMINDEFCLIGAKLFTGRTHQIRAHLASLNRYILGDYLYGYKGKDDLRVMLHAYILYFIHPRTKKMLFINAPLMDDFKNNLLKKYTLGELDEKISAQTLFSLFNSFV